MTESNGIAGTGISLGITLYVRERKGAVCVPKTIDFVDQVPLTGLGKPDKKTLRQRYWAEHQREIA